jgi:flagellar hook-associated protein 3 FlgL
MRISTSMIYSSGVSSMNQQTAAQLKLTQQLSSGLRITTPADDPVGASQVLQVQQAKDVNAQYTTNLSNAKSALGLEDSQLSGVTDILTRVQELSVQAGNSSYSDANRKAIAIELRSDFEQLVNIANATDGTGQYLFSGYKGSTQPFSGSVDALIAAPGSDVSYLGDDGQRTLTVAASTQVAVSDAGSNVFMRIPAGNGSFTTDYAAGNTGTGVISPGTVTNPAAWAAFANKPLTLSFTVAGAVTSYNVTDSTGASLAAGTYVPGQAITLAAQGISFTVAGAPANGDSFAIQASSSKSLFRSLADLIGTLETPLTTDAVKAKYQTDLGNAEANLTQASDNILRVQAGVGSREGEVTSLTNLNGDLDLQYAQTLSGLQDLDYVKAISELTQSQTNLQAAQKSFAAVSQLSLFTYI